MQALVEEVVGQIEVSKMEGNESAQVALQAELDKRQATVDALMDAFEKAALEAAVKVVSVWGLQRSGFAVLRRHGTCACSLLAITEA